VAIISRKRNYIFTLFSGFGGTAAASMIGLVSIPIALKYWTVERYGLWTLISSILVYLGVSNLGMNTAASTLMANANSIQIKFIIFKRSLRILISSAIFFSALICAVAVFFPDWIAFLGKIPANLRGEASTTFLIMSMFFLLNMPFSLVSSLYFAFQRTYIDNFFTILLSVLNFLSLLVVIFANGDLIFWAIFNGIVNFVFNVIKSLFFFFNVYKTLDSSKIENGEIVDCSSYKYILTTGVRFFLTSLSAMVVWNSDFFLISNFIGLNKVTEYSISSRPFQILLSMLLVFNASVFPLMAKEFADCNWDWINSTYQKLLVFSAILGGLFWIGGVFFLKDIVLLWTGDAGYAGVLTTVALGGYTYLLGMVNLNSGMLGTFNYMKNMASLGWVEAGIKIGSSLILLRYFSVSGIAIGTFLCFLLSVSWILPRWLTNRSEGRIVHETSFILSHFLFALAPVVVLAALIQYYIADIYTRLGLSVFFICSYLVISYVLMPKSQKIVYSHTAKNFLARFKT